MMLYKKMIFSLLLFTCGVEIGLCADDEEQVVGADYSSSSSSSSEVIDEDAAMEDEVVAVEDNPTIEIDALEEYGENACKVKLRTAHLDVVNLLVRLNVNLNQGYEKVLPQLEELNADVNGADSEGRTAVHVAAIKGDTTLFDRLVGAGANINAVSFTNGTPLMSAVFGGHVDIVDRLIERRADMNLRDEKGCTVLCWAVRRGHVDVVDRLFDAGSSIGGDEHNLFFDALADERVSLVYVLGIIDRLILQGCDVHGTNRVCGDDTVLIACVKKLIYIEENDKDVLLQMVERIISMGVDVNAVNRQGNTALMECIYLSRRMRHIEEIKQIAKRLIDGGADVSIKNNRGEKAMDLLREDEELNEIRQLLRDAVAK